MMIYLMLGVQGFGFQIKNAQLDGFSRIVNSGTSYVHWYKDGKADGKQLENFKVKDDCEKIYYENGNIGKWHGNDLENQYGRNDASTS